MDDLKRRKEAELDRLVPSGRRTNLKEREDQFVTPMYLYNKNSPQS